MADMQAAALASTTFINTKIDVLSPTSTPIMDECAICLEPYTNEAAARITGVPGCTHVIGVKCLEKLLTASPTQEKKCPICRTVWIAAPSQPRSVSDIRRHLIARTGSHRVGSRTAANQDPHPGQIIQIDSDTDSDDEVTAESFQQYRQDIADIRFRARQNQLSRRQRREEGAAARERDGGTVRGNSPLINTTGSSAGIVPTRSQTQRRTPFSSDPFASLNSRRARNIRPAGLPLVCVYPPRMPPILPKLDTENENEYDSSDDICMAYPNTAPSESPFRLSSSPETVDHNLSRRALDARARRVDEREDEMKNRERRLNEREHELHRKEQALFVREQRVAQMERKKDEFVELRRRQLDELRTMAQRHQEDMGRV